MKKQGVVIPIFLLAVAVFMCVSSFVTAPLVRGQSGGSNPVDPGEVWNPDGSLRTDLTLFGTVNVPLDPAAGVPLITEGTYTEYMTAEGNIVLVPGTLTLITMAAFPEAYPPSVLDPGKGSVTSAWALLGAAIGERLGQNGFDLTEYIQQTTNVTPEQFFRGLLSGNVSSEMAVGPQFLEAMIGLLANGDMDLLHMGAGVLLYNGSICAQLPGGCPLSLQMTLTAYVGTATAQPTQPPSQKCNAPVITSGEISAQAQSIAPKYPLVVGQDEAKRGVDLHYTLTIAPTIYKYQVLEVVGHHEKCDEWDAVGSCTHSKTVPDYACKDHTATVPEKVSQILPKASLTANSREWITGQLAQRYPGATVRHPDWVWGYAGPSYGHLNGDTYEWIFDVTKVQIVDPGIYQMIVTGSTTGTSLAGVGSTPSRSINFAPGIFKVYLSQAEIIH